MSEPIRIDGQAGFETRIDAISGKDNTPVTIVQWLRFGSQSSMRIIGSSPRTDWRRRSRASVRCATASSRAADRSLQETSPKNQTFADRRTELASSRGFTQS